MRYLEPQRRCEVIIGVSNIGGEKEMGKKRLAEVRSDIIAEMHNVKYAANVLSRIYSLKYFIKYLKVL